MLYECDMKVTNATKAIFEDLWITTAYARQVADVHRPTRGSACVTFSRQKTTKYCEEVLVMKQAVLSPWHAPEVTI